MNLDNKWPLFLRDLVVCAGWDWGTAYNVKVWRQNLGKNSDLMHNKTVMEDLGTTLAKNERNLQAMCGFSEKEKVPGEWGREKRKKERGEKGGRGKGEGRGGEGEDRAISACMGRKPSSFSLSVAQQSPHHWLCGAGVLFVSSATELCVLHVIMHKSAVAAGEDFCRVC